MKLLTFLTVMLVSASSLFAQVDFDFDDFDIVIFSKEKKPFLGINSAYTLNSYKNLSTELSPSLNTEFRIGYNYFGSTKRNLEKHSSKYISFTYSDPEIFKKEEFNIKNKYWRAGINSLSGFSYQKGNTYITPYISSAFTWTYMTANFTNATQPERESLELFHEAVRFGDKTELGLKVTFAQNIEIQAGFERNLIYSRHLFWYWAGSKILEETGKGLVDGFIAHVMNTSPDAVPIVNFLLKGAISYVFSEIKRDQAFWPFDSPAPYYNDSFGLGVNIIF